MHLWLRVHYVCGCMMHVYVCMNVCKYVCTMHVLLPKVKSMYHMYACMDPMYAGMYVCMYVCMYACTCLNMHCTCEFIFIHLYIQASKPFYMHACMYMYVCMYVCMYTSFASHMHTYISTCMHTYIHTYAHTCMHTCTVPCQLICVYMHQGILIRM
jgi:hypothetical protein